jgi:hypothetical protein
MEACQPDRKPLREESESRKRSAGDGLRYGENRAAKLRAVATKWLPDKKRGIAVSAKLLKKWCRLQDSNPRPTDYKSAALPTELSRRPECLCAADNRRVAASTSSPFVVRRSAVRVLPRPLGGGTGSLLRGNIARGRNTVLCPLNVMWLAVRGGGQVTR